MPRHVASLLIALLTLPSLVWAVTSEQVNTTSTQTLTNKTLTGPTVTDPSITGTVAGGASYTGPTLTNPTFSGAISGSASWDNPGAVGAGTPSTGKFTTLTATTGLIVGATPTVTSGTGSPEGVVTAPVGSLYLRTDGGAGTTVYIKETGAGNTGWTAVTVGGSASWSTPGTIGSTTPNTGAFTTLSATGQITSTLSTGTAPFVISSTTKSTNLNADLLDGGDWASPIAIGTTTPAAGSFTTLSATTSVAVGTPKIYSGTGSPEGVQTATVSSLYFRTDGSTGTTLYTKESGTGNAGWAVVAPSVINWAVPGIIGSTTPNSGIFTTLSAATYQYQIQAPTYGASVAIDASLGQYAVITATNNTAFTIQNPTSPSTGQILMIQVKNTSGGSLGAITWDTLYKMASFTKPSNGTRRTVTFLYDGTNWVEVNCSPEVPN